MNKARVPGDADGLPTTRDAVEEILRQEMQAEGAWQTCRVVGPLFTTATSQVYQAFTSDSDLPLAVKCTSPEEATEQYSALKKAARALESAPDFGSPNPVALIEGAGIVVMSWIEAPSLQHMCLDRKIPAADIQDVVRRCGQLLGCLHGKTHLTENTLDTDDFLNDIDLAFGEMQPPAAIRAPLDLLKETAADIHDRALPVAILHGDFKAANLLSGDAQAWVIDAALKWEGATVHDCAHFLNQFALDLYHPRGIRLRGRLDAMEQHFLSAYETTAEPVSRASLSWLRLQKLIVLYAEQSMRKSKHLASRYLILCIRTEMKRIMRSF